MTLADYIEATKSRQLPVLKPLRPRSLVSIIGGAVRGLLLRKLMKQRLVVFPILLIALVFVGCAKHRPRDKELEAIKLLGDAESADLGVPNFAPGADPTKSLADLFTRPGGVNGTIDAECGAAQEQIKKQAEGIVVTWLRGDSGPYAERPIAPGLPEAAAKLSQLGKQCSKLNLALSTMKSPEINKIREVLGVEDSVEKTPVSIGGHDIFVHRYGWIQFFVMNNQVTRVVFDFKNSGY
jgi:hypothetical protein